MPYTLDHDDITLSALAGVAYDALEARTRDGGERFTTQRDDAPRWVNDLVREAHGAFLPEDWRYESIHSALSAIYDADASDRDALEYDGSDSEWCDSNVDVYTADRYRWLASNLDRAGYVAEAQSEFGSGSPDQDITEMIGLGQYMESREVMSSVLGSLEARLEEIVSERPDPDDFYGKPSPHAPILTAALDAERSYRDALADWADKYNVNLPASMVSA